MLKESLEVTNINAQDYMLIIINTVLNLTYIDSDSKSMLIPTGFV